MADTVSRRSFLSWMGIGAAVAAVPVKAIAAELEPTRHYNALNGGHMAEQFGNHMIWVRPDGSSVHTSDGGVTWTLGI